MDQAGDSYRLGSLFPGSAPCDSYTFPHCMGCQDSFEANDIFFCRSYILGLCLYLDGDAMISYGGYTLHPNPSMVDIRVLCHKLKRSFFNRLFSLHPFKKYRVIRKTIYTPQDNIVVDKINMNIYGHPRLIKTIIDSIPNRHKSLWADLV